MVSFTNTYQVLLSFSISFLSLIFYMHEYQFSFYYDKTKWLMNLKESHFSEIKPSNIFPKIKAKWYE